MDYDPDARGLPVLAQAPPCRPQDLGSLEFRRDHSLELAYIAGAMANGIASVDMVEAMGRAGMLGFFGAAGLLPAEIEAAIDHVSTRLLDRPYGFNLIHQPQEPELEAATVELYLRRDLRLVSASAYLDLTLPLVRYRVHGIEAGPDGRAQPRNQVIAKVSRTEVAHRFFSPPPADMLAELRRRGEITEQQANLAGTIPMAQDVTVEADSGGHTDNRPLLTLLPGISALKRHIQAEQGYDRRLRVGAAGGISTPHAAAAAFTMGAAYVLTGSVNQACLEAGTSDAVRQLLAEVEQADVKMAPAADMFEMGVKLQVTSRKTMFAMRAQKLYDLYSTCDGLEEIKSEQRQHLEGSIFRASLEEVWQQTQAYWAQRDPEQIERALGDPKHKMALVFRWYLGQSSRWANLGDPERRLDYQVWCGPAMGAFNEWVRGSYLEDWHNRRVVPIAQNILHGAAVLTRAHALACQGTDLSSLLSSPIDSLDDLLPAVTPIEPAEFCLS